MNIFDSVIFYILIIVLWCLSLFYRIKSGNVGAANYVVTALWVINCVQWIREKRKNSNKRKAEEAWAVKGGNMAFNVMTGLVFAVVLVCTVMAYFGRKIPYELVLGLWFYLLVSGFVYFLTSSYYKEQEKPEDGQITE